MLVLYVTGQLRCAVGKATVGLALHWPYVTDLGGLAAYVLKVCEQR